VDLFEDLFARKKILAFPGEQIRMIFWFFVIRKAAHKCIFKEKIPIVLMDKPDPDRDAPAGPFQEYFQFRNMI